MSYRRKSLSVVCSGVRHMIVEIENMRNLLIFSLLWVAINADGKFAILQAPNSLSFQGNEPVPAGDVGDICAASTGNFVRETSGWSGLTINDPFGLPRQVVVALIQGVTIDVTPAVFESTIAGAGVGESLSNFVGDAKEDKLSTCDVDYNTFKATFQKCFRNSVSHNEAPALPSTTSLSKDDTVAKDFLSAIADVNAAVDNYQKTKNNKDVEMKSVVVLRLNVQPIVKAYGSESAQVTEAVTLLKNTLAKLQKVSGDNLFVVVSGIDPAKLRSKRDVVQPNKTNPLNLGYNYDSNYPVIFNIILWFMVAFALSLLAISYAIGSMDPGRDSIIYRMTSTRMKKDN